MSGNGSLFPSSPDMITLVEAVESRFLTLCEGWLRKRGVKLPIPKLINRDIMRWREVRLRHKALGDMRNTAAEVKSVKAVAQWTVTMNCELRGQPDKQIVWTT